MRIFALAVGLILAANMSAADDSTRDERLAIATEHVEATLEDIDMTKVIAQMYQPILDQVEASGQQITQGQREELQAYYMQEFEQPMRDIMLAQDEIMADLLTLEEITALRDFYNTGPGKSVMIKLPDILAAQQPMIIEMVGAKIPAMLPRIQSILAPN